MIHKDEVSARLLLHAPLAVAALADFLRDGVESVESDTVRLKLISPLRPGLIQGDGDDFWYLIMPIRLPS